MNKPITTPFKILLIDDDHEMNSQLHRLLEGHRIQLSGATIVPAVQIVDVALVQYKPSYWRIAESTFIALDRVSAESHDLLMVDFALTDEKAKDILWGRDRSRTATKAQAKNRLLTIRDLAEQYAKHLDRRRHRPARRNIFLETRRVVLRSMAPNLGFDILGPVVPNRLNETRAAFPNAYVAPLDPRNEFYGGDAYYDFYDRPRGREFYRQLVGSHYLRIVEAEVLRAALEMANRYGALFQASSTTSAMEFTVFLSHSSTDSERAERLHSRLREQGFTAYLARHELTGGDVFSDEIRTALRHSRELWVLVTPSSLKSAWVLSEWGAAWALGKRIVPVLHRCGPDDLPDRLRSLQSLDYDELESGLEQLSRRVRSSEETS
jgi:hypothetical protein